MAPLAAWLFLLKPADVVWDVGASVGLFALHSATRSARVLAFEPDPVIAGRCRENIVLNKLQQKVEVLDCALGSSPGTLALHSDGLHGLAPSLKPSGRHQRVIEVKVSTIDECLAAGLPVPTAVKIDVEGAESEVLRGARQLFGGPQAPRLLFLEIHPVFLPCFNSTEAAVAEELDHWGYKVLTTHRRDDQYHLIAIRPEQRPNRQ